MTEEITLPRPLTDEQPVDLLRTSDEYRAALRDGRRVWFEGEYVDDVTTHPAFRGAVDMVAAYFDAHHDGPYADVLTERREDGILGHAAFSIPRDLETLRRRRKVIEAVVDLTDGTLGRSPEFMPLLLLGLYANREFFLASNPELGANVERFFEHARRTHPVMAWAFVDPQADKRLPASEKAYLRVVDRREDGIVVSGAKVVATLAAQADELIVTTLFRPDLDPDSAIWCAVPVAAEGITLVCREGLATEGQEIEHPLRSRGDEVDAMVLFDNVFVPWDRVFNIGDVELPRRYTSFALWTHWYALARLTYRFEIIAGAAALIPKVVGTRDIPQVKDMVTEILRYLETCRALLTSAEERCNVLGGVAHSNWKTNTTGRMYAIENYPRVMSVLRELSGQGLIMRFPDAVFDDTDLAPQLQRALTAQNYDGRDKTKIFNLIWDLCCDSFAARMELFEQFNSLSVPVLRQLYFMGYSKDELAAMERKACAIAGVEEAPGW
jgi:4-hydroxyphenylacetate 3-monooxygenase